MGAVRVALCLLAFLLAAAPAEAYEPAGAKWPRGRVTYYVAAKQHAAAVATAARAWNASGARVRFTRTRSRRRADLVVTYRGTADLGCREGLASVGRASRGRLYLPRLTGRSPYGDLMCVRTAVHELGHVLGLSHEDGTCATMNSAGLNLAPIHCPRHEPWAWRCRLLEPDDVRGAVRRYGGRVRAAREPAECDLYPAAPAPTDLAAAYDPQLGVIGVSFRRPAASTVPPWLVEAVAPNGGLPGAYEITATRDTCPVAPPDDIPYRYQEAQPGGIEQHQQRIDGPGRWCVAVWHVDELSRAGAAPAAVFVDVA